MYEIVSAPTMKKLEEDVTEYLQRGWNTAGGVTVVQSTTNGRTITLFMQAVYRDRGLLLDFVSRKGKDG